MGEFWPCSLGFFMRECLLGPSIITQRSHVSSLKMIAGGNNMVKHNVSWRSGQTRGAPWWLRVACYRDDPVGVLISLSSNGLDGSGNQNHP